MPASLAIEVPTAEQASSDYWDKRARSWGQIAAPLRPTEGDVAAIVDTARDWATHHGPPRIVLFGVTPELAMAAWPGGARLLAVDYSMGMIRQVWPQEAAGVLCADWRDLPLRSESVDLVVGDGCFAMTRYPDDYARIGAAIRRALASVGACAMRFFVRPAEREGTRDVLDDLWAGRIGNFHVLKWRLAMALQRSSEEGVSLGDVWTFWQSQDIDPADLGARMGWTQDTVRSIETYRGSTTRFAFPTLDEIRAALAPALVPSSIRVPAYEMGSRCPTLILRPVR